MAPVGPHDHVANKVRLRGRRTDAHLSPPQSSVLSLSVAYLHGRPGSRSAGERAPNRSVPALGVCLRSGLRVHWSSLLRPASSVVRFAIAARPVLGARRAVPATAFGFAHSALRFSRLARRARPVVCARPRGPATVCRRYGVSKFVPRAPLSAPPPPAAPPRRQAARNRPWPMPMEDHSGHRRAGAERLKKYVLNCK